MLVRSDCSLVKTFLCLFIADADDFTPLPPVLAKEELKVKSQWDDEDLEEEPKEEEKPKPVRIYINS